MNDLSIVKSDVKNEADWMSKKELMDFCKCSKTTLEQIISDLNLDTGVQIQTHIKKGGYHNLETFYDDYLVKLIQAKLFSNQTNQGNSSDTIKSVVKDAVKNELTKTLSKDEIKLELEREKEQREQYKKQREIIIEQYKKQREQYKKQREQYKKQREIITDQNTAKLKEIELELLHQKEISKALKTKNFTEPIKQGIMSMFLELAQAAVQAEYTNKLKQLDDYGNIQYDY